MRQIHFITKKNWSRNNGKGDGNDCWKLVRLLLYVVPVLTVATYLTILNHRDDTSTTKRLTTTDDSIVIEYPECEYYLAESAIPKNPGLGVYTAKDIKKHDYAQPFADICLYVADTPKKTHFKTHSWAKYVWFGQFEGNNPRGACEGFATLFNTEPPGLQTSKLTMIATHDNAGIKRSEHPNAGAITHYTGITSVATRDVKAGAELTIDYGDWEYRSKDYIRKPPIRTVPWLQQHGMCIDNIRIGQATDPTMGRGAFANRNLKSGSRVSPAPLQFFRNRTMFAGAFDNHPEALFVNYCFEIANTTIGTDMLVFPYGPGVNLINHNHQQPNVGLRWSTHSMHRAHWLDLPLELFLEVDYPGGLILDIVALRDIQEGEELFLDYGETWDDAWKEHVQNWEPIKDDDNKKYVYPQDMDKSQPFRTLKEQEKEPYPDNLGTVCTTENWKRKGSKKVMKWRDPGIDWPEHFVRCNILKRKENNTTDTNEPLYEVSVIFDDTFQEKDKRMYIDTNVPHSAIYFVDKPYQSDMHLKNAFRHTIEFPKELIPKHWV